MRGSRLPDPLPPMRAVTGELPADDAGWAFEVKWDGMRAIAFLEEGHLRLQSSRLLEITGRFPDVASLTGLLAERAAVLDGELVAFDDAGRPSFGRLQQRMHVGSASEARRRAAALPVTYVVFDLLHLDGVDLVDRPYEWRRDRLAALLPAAGPDVRVSTHHVGDGDALLEAARHRGLEGLLAKRLDSRYEVGRRSPAWRKVKVRRRQELVVGGWLPGSGGREGRLGALLVGYHDLGAGPPPPLRYAGRVGTGFTERELARLEGLLAPLAVPASPFDPPPPRPVTRAARYVAPRLVAEVAFGEWTDEGRLRHPSYLGLRADKAPEEVVREPS